MSGSFYGAPAGKAEKNKGQRIQIMALTLHPDGNPFGTHRVLEPHGALPQPAEKLDNDIYEWRGKVQNVSEDEGFYFRGWLALIEILQTLVSEGNLE